MEKGLKLYYYKLNGALQHFRPQRDVKTGDNVHYGQFEISMYVVHFEDCISRYMF